LTKDEAREEAIRRWHALPEEERQTHRQAQIFAASLADDLDFRTMGNTRKIITAWLVHDMSGGRMPPATQPADPADDTEDDDAEPQTGDEATLRSAAE
jgi:hypothetical protein